MSRHLDEGHLRDEGASAGKDRFPDADRLDRMIDEVTASVRDGRQGGAADVGEADDVVAALSRVTALAGEPVEPSVRARHLARIRTSEPASRRRRSRVGTPAPLAGLRRRLAPIAAAATTLVLVGAGGTVAAAQDAGPDDMLYGVKRASEQVWETLPRGSERAAAVHLTLAQRRLAEARQAPHHAAELVAEGVADAEQAAEELPGQAVDTLSRLLGDGEGSLPAQASPAARAALHRNCVKIAAKRGLDDSPCGPAPDYQHPGRGRGPGGAKAEPGAKEREPRGWGPGGRPEGETGPPPHSRGWGPGGRPEGETGPPPHARGWGPGGRPDDWVGPPPGVPGRGPEPRDETTEPDGS